MAVGARVRIYGDWDGSGVKKAEKDLSSFNQQVSGFTGAMSKSFLGVGAAIGGAFALTSIVSGFTNFLRDSTQAALEDEKSLVSLAVAMNNLGLATENAGVEDFVLQLSLATGVADDQLRPAMQRLLTVTGDVTKSQDTLRLAMDIAQGTGRDLESVVLALSRGFGGNTTALSRLGAGLDQATLKSKDMDLITAALADKFSGQAAAAAETFQGKINRLNVAVGEAQETIGYELLIALDNASTSLGGVGGFSDVVTKSAEKVANLIAGIGLFTTTLSRFRLELARQGTPADAFISALGDIIVRVDRLVNPVQRVIGIFSDLGEENRKTRGAISATTQAAIAAGSAMSQTLTPETYDAAAAADKAAKSYLALWESIWNTRRAAADLANTSGTVTSALALGAKTGGVPEYWEKLRVAYGEAVKSLSGGGGVSEALDTAKQKQDEFNKKLADGREAVQNAIKQAQEYASSIQKSFVDALDLGAALDKAKESGASIVEEFIKQGERMAAFSANIRKLLAAGLERPAFDAIIRAGAQRGADIAAALAEGNIRENAAQVNNVYRSVADLGIQVGQQATPVFESVGVLQAQSMLETMIREFMPAGKKRRALLQSIEDMVQAGLANLARLTGAQIPSGGAGSSPGAAAPVPELLPPIEVPVPNFSTMQFYEGYNVAPTTAPKPFSTMQFYPGYAFADGGIVMKPTMGLVGEAGPEAIIPLSQYDRGGSGQTINLTVNAGMGTDGAEVGRQIVDALRQYQRRNGPVPISVA